MRTDTARPTFSFQDGGHMKSEVDLLQRIINIARNSRAVVVADAQTAQSLRAGRGVPQWRDHDDADVRRATLQLREARMRAQRASVRKPGFATVRDVEF